MRVRMIGHDPSDELPHLHALPSATRRLTRRNQVISKAASSGARGSVAHRVAQLSISNQLDSLLRKQPSRLVRGEEPEIRFALGGVARVTLQFRTRIRRMTINLRDSRTQRAEQVGPIRFRGLRA